MKSEKLYFAGHDGHRLAGYLDTPESPRAYALFAHCFTCSKNIKAAVHVSQAMAGEGVAVLRFDFAGIGESEGEFAATNFTSNVADLKAAARFLAEHYQAPEILIGHSLGGTAVLRAARDIPSVRAVAVIAAPFEPIHVTHHFGELRERILQQGEAEVEIGGQRFLIRRQFIEDLEAHPMQDVIRDLGCALAVFHSPMDRTVPVEDAARIFQAARHPKSYISLDRADHLLSDPADSRYVGTLIAAWARKYVE
jgi:putative redox protein